MLNGNQERVIRSIKTFGFNEYEGRVMFTLQVMGELTALELARKSGIPQNKVYDVIYKLVDLGIASIKDGKPMTIRPSNIPKRLERICSKSQRNMERSGRYLSELVAELAPLARKYHRMRVFTPTYNSR